MIFAGAESVRFRSDLRFPVPGTAAVPVCASAAVAGCLYVHEIFSMRDAAACPTDCCPADCCPPAACFLLSAVCRLPPAARRLLPAFCFLLCDARCPPPVRQVDATCRFAWRAALSGISGIAVPALFPAPSVAPGFFALFPAPSRAGTPRKSNGAAVVRMRRRGICLPLFGEFPGSPAGVGLGPQP